MMLRATIVVAWLALAVGSADAANMLLLFFGGAGSGGGGGCAGAIDLSTGCVLPMLGVM
jgi:hypothetical protein